MPDVPRVMADTIRAIDDIFVRLAEVGALESWGLHDLRLRPLSVAAAVEQMWRALGAGRLRLVVDGERLHVEPFKGTATERRVLAGRHWPIIRARRRVLAG